jgi:lysozyme
MSVLQRFREWLQRPVGGVSAEPAAAPVWPTAPATTTDEPAKPAGTVRMDRLRLQLEMHEGVRATVYLDTEGHPTIGIGRNLDAKPFDSRERAVIGDRDLDRIGLTAGEIGMLFRRDVADAIVQLDRHLPWWRSLDEVRRRVMVDLMFNMGPGDEKRGLLSFVNTLGHIQAGRYQQAADGMAASKWSRQTGTRADRLIRMMRTGEDWTA